MDGSFDLECRLFFFVLFCFQSSLYSSNSNEFEVCSTGIWYQLPGKPPFPNMMVCPFHFCNIVLRTVNEYVCLILREKAIFHIFFDIMSGLIGSLTPIRETYFIGKKYLWEIIYKYFSRILCLFMTVLTNVL